MKVAAECQGEGCGAGAGVEHVEQLAADVEGSLRSDVQRVKARCGAGGVERAAQAS